MDKSGGCGEGKRQRLCLHASDETKHTLVVIDADVIGVGEEGASSEQTGEKRDFRIMKRDLDLLVRRPS